MVAASSAQFCVDAELDDCADDGGTDDHDGDEAGADVHIECAGDVACSLFVFVVHEQISGDEIAGVAPVALVDAGWLQNDGDEGGADLCVECVVVAACSLSVVADEISGMLPVALAFADSVVSGGGAEAATAQ